MAYELIQPLYKPTLKDIVQGLVVGRVILSDPVGVSASATVVNNNNLAATPPDLARFIDGITVEASSGAAQTVTSVVANFIRGSTYVMRVSRQPEFAFAAAVGYSWYFPNVNWLLFPGDRIQLAATFSAGANPNAVFGYAWGYEIPRANIQGA